MAKCANIHVSLLSIKADTTNVAIDSSSESCGIDSELDSVIVRSHHNDLAVTTSSDDMSWGHCDCINQLCVVLACNLRTSCTIPHE